MVARIFSDTAVTTGSSVELTGNPATHIYKVLRLRAGDSLVVFDGSGAEYAATIETASRSAVAVIVGDGHEPGTESPLDVTLLQGICRGQRMDLLVQKSTELGVAAIRPVACERSVVRLDDARARRKVLHWRQIAISACEQSGRVRIPEVADPAPLERALTELAALPGTRLLLDPAADRSLGEALDSPEAVVLLVGPEGGLSGGERRAAIAAGFRAASLGPRILRTETAPLAALSLIQYLAGDLARSARD